MIKLHFHNFFLTVYLKNIQVYKATMKREGEMKKTKVVRWWTKKTSIEKSITILTFIMLAVVIQILVLSIGLNETIRLLLKAIRQECF